MLTIPCGVAVVYHDSEAWTCKAMMNHGNCPDVPSHVTSRGEDAVAKVAAPAPLEISNS